ncbi:MAG: ParB/RepB/Spo0J family partition protein [Myxococcota bacterium]
MRDVSVYSLQPGACQPRESFAEETLVDLAASVAQHGVLQPLLVRELANGRYEIVAGERRWRAAKRAGRVTVPCVVMDVADHKTLALALIENIQREDLNALEEAKAYQRLMDATGCTQEQLAAAIGKSRAAVANTLRLLKLPDSIKQLIVSKRITSGHARALVGLDAELAGSLARQIAQQGMTVRQAEVLARSSKQPRGEERRKGLQKESFVHQQIQRKLQQHLGTRVELRHKGEGGSVVLHFASARELNRLLRLLTT